VRNMRNARFLVEVDNDFAWQLCWPFSLSDSKVFLGLSDGNVTV
jgi:hypothetical protein